MKKSLGIMAAGLIAATSCTSPQKDDAMKWEQFKVVYPVTNKENVQDTLFGKVVNDPYRWLEDDLSDQTANWVAMENEVTFGYLNKIPFKDSIKKRLEEIWNYEKVGAPFKEGDYYYFYKNDGLQNQYVLYRYQNEGDEPELFLDPNSFSADGTTSLAGLSFSPDGTLAAYQISEGGSDWRKVIIINAVSNEVVEDTLIDVKFSGLSWRGNEGFYYSSYDKPKEGSQLSGKTHEHKLLFHKLGTAQSEDELIFGGSETPRRYIGGYVTEDGQYLVISCANSTSGNELYVKKIGTKMLFHVVENFDFETDVVHTEGNDVYMITNVEAPNKRLVKATFPNLSPEHWVEVIPETKEPLSVSTGGGYLFASYLKDATSAVFQYSLAGENLRMIDLPGVGSASGIGGKWDEKSLYFSFTNYVQPGTIYTLDVENGNVELFRKSNVKFNADQYESKQVFYTSKDGTKVPMILTYKKGIELNGKNPTILYGYGGFNISLTPSFSVSRVPWLENGGIYAVANLRGGGEYGREWHDAGTQMQKQNVFDDFIAAAEYLFANGYTSSEKLAIKGGSNGGLLVGATMTQRPDLAAVALPAVGVLDMLRYHKFTAGAGWAYDYGTADDNEEMFNYLLNYSPVHNVKAVEYPATMITTADHDDRVVPAHSFKFAAALQEFQVGANPVLIRIDVNAGHGAGKPTDMIIEGVADEYAFCLWNMKETSVNFSDQ